MLGKRMLEIREYFGLSQIEMSQRLGITQSGLSAQEKGKNVPNGELLALISKEFGVDGDWLLKGEGTMFGGNDQPKLTPIKEVKMLASGLDTSEVSTLKQMNLFLQGLVDKLMNELSEKDKTLAKC